MLEDEGVVTPEASRHLFVSDCGDGTFRNPILPLDYADPDVIRQGDDFWMTCSSGHDMPGLPILHSRDLVSWQVVNHALPDWPGAGRTDVPGQGGVFSPALRYDPSKGKYFIFFTVPEAGLYVTSASEPGKTWVEPWLLPAAPHVIQPCPIWGQDRKAYLLHISAKSVDAPCGQIYLSTLASDGKRLSGEEKMIIDTPQRRYVEGLNAHYFAPYYYLFTLAQTEQGEQKIIFRARELRGPYEEKIVQKAEFCPWYGCHRRSIIDLPSDESWFIHAVSAGACGRTVHLQPMTWRDGWPFIGQYQKDAEMGKPVQTWHKPTILGQFPPIPYVADDEFDEATLSRNWQWNGPGLPAWFSVTARPGWLRLYAQPCVTGRLTDHAAVLLQKLPAQSVRVETKLDFTGTEVDKVAGLVLIGGGEFACLGLISFPTGYVLIHDLNGEQEQVTNLLDATVSLRMEFDEKTFCTFSYAVAGGPFLPLPRSCQVKSGKDSGAKIGLFSKLKKGVSPAKNLPTGSADFDYFRFTARPEENG